MRFSLLLVLTALAAFAGACASSGRPPGPPASTVSAGAREQSVAYAVVVDTDYVAGPDTSPRLFRGVHSVVSALIPPGEVHGTVIDAESRAPLAVAVVADPALVVGVYTDSLGRFRLGPPRGRTASSYKLTVRLIGYEPRTFVLPMPVDMGRSALITLERRPLNLCHGVTTGFPGGHNPAVRVHVRMTSLPAQRPLAPLIVSLRHETGADTVILTMDYSRGAIVDLGLDSIDQHLTVSIRGADIREWTRSVTRPCGPRKRVDMEAWLFPR